MASRATGSSRMEAKHHFRQPIQETSRILVAMAFLFHLATREIGKTQTATMNPRLLVTLMAGQVPMEFLRRQRHLAICLVAATLPARLAALETGRTLVPPMVLCRFQGTGNLDPRVPCTILPLSL